MGRNQGGSNAVESNLTSRLSRGATKDMVNLSINSIAIDIIATRVAVHVWQCTANQRCRLIRFNSDEDYYSQDLWRI